ncbi:MAG TPA: L-2-amino-thiazoline-4-carboxylic acid hydrolase [Anaerolineae bacterium]|nr:L-2-amino-thiazoline-4-carboxylic acid hydrolase [Anaerolineae bacterium]
MRTIPCRERRFPLWLASEFEYHHWYSLHWLKHLLERLGREHTLALWEDAFRAYDEELLVQILSTGWEAVEESETEDAEEQVSASLAELFAAPVEGVTSEKAREILQNTPPFQQIRQQLPALNVRRESTTYEALHLFRDGLALITELLIDRYGKQGELIAYDTMLGELSAGPEPRVSVEDFMSKRAARFSSEPNELNMHAAGLEVEFIRSSGLEVVTRVTECEWARYYRERHPQVGYMMACALDNAVYRSLNDRIRLQRTITLMEGGTGCDFRVYAVEE